jgi:hypothetical protein
MELQNGIERRLEYVRNFVSLLRNFVSLLRNFVSLFLLNI